MTGELEAVSAILAAGRTAAVTTRTAEGALHSRPLAVLDDESDTGTPGPTPTSTAAGTVDLRD